MGRLTFHRSTVAPYQYIFTMKDLSKVHPPNKKVLKDIWLSFYSGAKIGVLGANGAGKSTLLQHHGRRGQGLHRRGAARRRASRVGFLPQEPQLDPAQGRARQRRGGRRADAARLLDRLRARSARGSASRCRRRDGRAARASRASCRTASTPRDAWDLDRAARDRDGRPALPPADADVTTLSGGERRRVALCRLLLQQPDLLLLDEPTNHLDAESVAWLERHLQEYPGTVVAVTHDRYFLDNVAGWILELDRGEGIPVEGQLLVLARAEAAAARARGEAGGRRAADAGARARVDPACRRARGRPSARRASTPTRSCSPRTREAAIEHG